MKVIFLMMLSAMPFLIKAQTNYYLLVGTYTSGKSEGIYVYNFNTGTGDFSMASKIKSSNPSYLAVSASQKFVYAVYEDGNNNGSVAAFGFNKLTGVLTKINQQLTGGDHPCYVAIDKTDKWVTAANYTGGSVSVLPVMTNGGLNKASSIIKHTGSSINLSRQASPHVHCTYFSKDNKFLFTPDLGTDKVMIYSFNQSTGKLTTASQAFAKSVPGSGPRHIDIHPNNKYAYLMEELTGTVVVYNYNAISGTLNSLQRLSAAPANFTGAMGSADIHVSADGKFLYCSNRGASNTITIFKINPDSGILTFVDQQATLGISPRNFTLDPSGNFLLVANQSSDNIIIFKRDVNTGLLTNTGKKIDVGNPVCLKWISK